LRGMHLSLEELNREEVRKAVCHCGKLKVNDIRTVGRAL
jgi:hypothetical protein